MAKPVITVISMSLLTLILLVSLLVWISKPLGVAHVRWQAPAEFEDSTSLHSSEIEEYEIYWSNEDQTVKGQAKVPGSEFSYQITGLTLEKFEISIIARSIYGTKSAQAKVSVLVKAEKS